MIVSRNNSFKPFPHNVFAVAARILTLPAAATALHPASVRPDDGGVAPVLLYLAGSALMAAAGFWLGKVFSRASGPRRRNAEMLEMASSCLHANDIVLAVTDVGQIIEANDRAVESYGYSLSELTGMNIRDLRCGEEQDVFERHWTEVEARGSLRFETMHRRRDGSCFPVEVSSRIVRVGGRPFRQSIIRDITERRETENRLKETLASLAQSEARLRLVVEKAPEAIIVEIGTIVRYANPAAVTLIGANTESELIGVRMLELTHPEEREEVAARSAAVAAGRSVPLVDRRIFALNGELKHVEASATPVEYEGKPASLVFLRDVSERRKNEVERASLEAQLGQAQKLESIGRLAGGVAHDFNNHLTVINGYCDMLLTQLESSDPVRESIAEIRAAGERASGLTQQLLAFSRKQVIEPKPVGLNESIADAARMIRRLIGEDIEMVTRLASPSPVIMADKGQINQILLNLAVNARDAMPEGGVFTLQTGVVEIDAHYAAHHPEARPGSFATLTVNDTGVGMTREIVTHIFEPFFTTKKPGAGTGLGLSTVYGIVRQSGGWIRVYSEPGMGAAFEMYFPRVDAAHELPSSLSETAPGGSETILVVEDQEEVRRLTIAALGQFGYRTIEACDGAEAVRKASEVAESIDLLFTDVVMPGMSGVELASRMAQARPGIRVLFTSGYSEEAMGSNRMLSPGCVYLAKPFTAAQLAAKIREALSGSASGKQA